MGLMDTLNQCIAAGHEMTKAIAIAQFNDDSPEARKITRRWRVGEAADLIGVSSQKLFVTLKKLGDCLIQIWNYEDALNSALAIPLSK